MHCCEKARQFCREKRGYFFLERQAVLCSAYCWVCYWWCGASSLSCCWHHIVSYQIIIWLRRLKYFMSGMSMRNSHKQFRGHHQPTTTAPLTPSRHIKILSTYFTEILSKLLLHKFLILLRATNHQLYIIVFYSQATCLFFFKCTQLLRLCLQNIRRIDFICCPFALYPIEGSKRNHFVTFLSGKIFESTVMG